MIQYKRENLLARVFGRSVSKDKVIRWKRKIRKRRAGCHLSAKISLVVLILPLAPHMKDLFFVILSLAS